METDPIDIVRGDAVRAMLDALSNPDGRCVASAWDRVTMLYGRTGAVMKRYAFEQYLDELAPDTRPETGRLSSAVYLCTPTREVDVDSTCPPAYAGVSTHVLRPGARGCLCGAVTISASIEAKP